MALPTPIGMAIASVTTTMMSVLMIFPATPIVPLRSEVLQVKNSRLRAGHPFAHTYAIMPTSKSTIHAADIHTSVYIEKSASARERS